jgi:hypothetical protein
VNLLVSVVVEYYTKLVQERGDILMSKQAKVGRGWWGGGDSLSMVWLGLAVRSSCSCSNCNQQVLVIPLVYTSRFKCKHPVCHRKCTLVCPDAS